MNLPATQEKIRRDLRSAVERFLDTAPAGSVLFRTSIILGILRDYFRRRLARKDSDAYDKATAEEVLAGLSFAGTRIRADEDVEKWLAEIMAAPPITDEEFETRLKEWEALDARLKTEGKKAT